MLLSPAISHFKYITVQNISLANILLNFEYIQSRSILDWCFLIQEWGVVALWRNVAPGFSKMVAYKEHRGAVMCCAMPVCLQTGSVVWRFTRGYASINWSSHFTGYWSMSSYSLKFSNPLMKINGPPIYVSMVAPVGLAQTRQHANSKHHADWLWQERDTSNDIHVALQLLNNLSKWMRKTRG